MTVSVIIPAAPKDVPLAERLKRSLRGAGEVLIMQGGTATENRNAGAANALFDELLFLDCDVTDVDKIDLSTLDSYGFDVATTFLRLNPIDMGWTFLQNWSAYTGAPLALFGAFIYARRSAFLTVGPFRQLPSEDTEWGHRAWVLGYNIDHFPFYVTHARPLGWGNHLGPLYNGEGVWGIP